MIKELEGEVLAVRMLQEKEKDLPKTESGIYVSNESITAQYKEAEIIMVSDELKEKRPNFAKRAVVGRKVALPFVLRKSGDYDFEINGEKVVGKIISPIDITGYL